MLKLFASGRISRIAALGVTIVAGGGTIAVATHPATAAATFAAVTGAVTCATSGTSACQSYANSSSGIAVEGTSKSGTGVRASSTSNYGIKSTSSTGDAIFGQVTSTPSTLGTVAAGVVGTSPDGYGVYGYTTKGGVGGVFSGEIGVVASGTDYLFDGVNGKNLSVFTVDNDGDVTYMGSLMSDARTKSGATIAEFSPRSSAPTIEDTGTAQLVGGTATIHLDPAFAATIDTASPYRVFVTPDGDTRGLYVTSKTPQGFVVRESQAGRSTVAFDYRIIAASIGEGGKRMSVIAPNERPNLRLPVSPNR